MFGASACVSNTRAVGRGFDPHPYRDSSIPLNLLN